MTDESEPMKRTTMELAIEGIRCWIKTYNVGQERNQISFAIL